MNPIQIYKARLKEVRKSIRGATQAIVAVEAGLSNLQHLSAIESDQTWLPRPDTALQLHNALASLAAASELPNADADSFAEELNFLYEQARLYKANATLIDARREPIGGAVSPYSPFYLSRPADDLAHEALARKDSFLLIKGVRQVGKSSLIARLYHSAREAGTRVVRSDWQKIPQATLETDRAFLGAMAETLAEDLELDSTPQSHFVTGRAGTTSFERFIRKDVLPAVNGPLVWFIDEADRLFDMPYRDDVFAMLRSWHGERAIDYRGRWDQFTVVLTYATDAYLFISNLDQSPFNVGTRIELEDFTFEQVGEMNRRYGSPLKDEAEAKRLFSLVGGHPYLIRRFLMEMVQRDINMSEIETLAGRSDTLFNDHLGRLRVALQRDPELLDALRAHLSKGTPPSFNAFMRLRSAGVVRGESPHEMTLRYPLYELYFKRTLL